LLHFSAEFFSSPYLPYYGTASAARMVKALINWRSPRDEDKAEPQPRRATQIQ